MSVCGSVCLSVCPRGYLRSHKSHMRSLPIFMHVAYVRGSVLIRHAYDRPHRLSPGRCFLPLKNALSAGKGDGSAQRGRSMLSTIALLSLVYFPHFSVFGSERWIKLTIRQRINTLQTFLHRIVSYRIMHCGSEQLVKFEGLCHSCPLLQLQNPTCGTVSRMSADRRRTNC